MNVQIVALHIEKNQELEFPDKGTLFLNECKKIQVGLK